MSYYLFLDKIQLPVPPAKLQLRINNQNKTVNLINNGEINILKSSGLKEVSFQALLPNSRYPFASYFGGFHKADYFLEKFEQLKIGLKPFQFIFCRMGLGLPGLLFDSNLTVALEDYEIVEDANNGQDVMVSIKLKQYKPYATKLLSIQTAADGTKTASVEQKRPTNREIVQTFKTISKQTLWEICKKELGEGSKWQEIAKLNKIINPNQLIPGQVLKLVNSDKLNLGQVIKFAK